jgi:hypothetical protein
MPMKILPILTIFLCILSQFSAHGQKKKKNAEQITFTRNDSLFADFDLFTLRGIKSVPRNNPDSLRKLVKYSRTSTGEIKEIEVIRKFYSGLHTRKATIQHTSLGVLIGFRTLKTPGWEKIMFIGQKYYYHDSILIRNDTIFTKSLYDDGITLEAILPVKNDTLRIRHIWKSYRGPYADENDPWNNFVHYKEWFGENDWDKAETYTFVNKEGRYELIQVNTNKDYLIESTYKSLRDDYLKLGLSAFWIALEENLTWDY